MSKGTIFELPARPQFLDGDVNDLQLRQRYGLTILAVRTHVLPLLSILPSVDGSLT
jgi:K+/H+ antiporter YhaU regulatory subunit KhtT